LAAGWGAFLHDGARKDDFIGEYTGDLITQVLALGRVALAGVKRAGCCAKGVQAHKGGASPSQHLIALSERPFKAPWAALPSAKGGSALCPMPSAKGGSALSHMPSAKDGSALCPLPSWSTWWYTCMWQPYCKV